MEDPCACKSENFLWRMAKNILPTKHNLLKKGIHLDLVCSLCCKKDETARHLFMECEFARGVLFSSILTYKILTDVDLKDWMLGFLSCGDVFSSQIICNIAYQILLSRNLKLYQDRSSSLVQVAEQVMASVMDFNKWNNSKGGEQHEEEVPDTYKQKVHIVQVDASIFADGFMTTGCIIHDHHRVITIAACKREHIIVEAIVGEAMAIRWGQTLAKEMKLEKIVIKTDAKGVVDFANFVRWNIVLEPLAIHI